MGNPFDFGAEARATDEELLESMRRLAVLSEAELTRLLPAPSDREQLRALIRSVDGAAADNDRAANLRSQLGAVSANVSKLLKTLT